MQTQRIEKTFFQYAFPAVIGMVVQALYVILDGIIVGQGIGELALAAINIAFPCTMVVIALAMLISMGGANVYSFYKGQKAAEQANNVFTQCFWLAISVGALIAVAGFLFRRPLALFFGADETLLPDTVVYLKWIAPFSLLQMMVCLLSTFIRNDDAPKMVMAATVTGAVINALLDVIFILILDFGIEAAAITNGIGMTIELVFYAVHFLRKKGVLRIRRPYWNRPDLKRIFSNGFATFLMEFSLPAVTFSFNLAIMQTVGTLGITAYSIAGYVCAIINMTLIGVTHGAQPLMGFYHGSGNQRAFQRVYRLGIRTNIVVSVFLVLLCFVFSSDIVVLFRSGNAELTDLTATMLRVYPLAHIPIGITLMNILYFQTTERNAFSSFVSLLRCVGFIQVFLLLSLFVLDGTGLYGAFFAGEFCHLIISYLLLRKAKHLDHPALPIESV